MKNVTISMRDDTARWARVEAAKAGKSLSRWIGEKLETEQADQSRPRSSPHGLSHLEAATDTRAEVPETAETFSRHLPQKA